MKFLDSKSFLVLLSLSGGVLGSLMLLLQFYMLSILLSVALGDVLKV